MGLNHKCDLDILNAPVVITNWRPITSPIKYTMDYTI